jgi:hypothetical protein
MKSVYNSSTKSPELLRPVLTRLPWLGIILGVLLTACLWLGDSEKSYTTLRWILYAGITIVGLVRLIHTSRRRALTVLALSASIAILYLFPELLGPGCSGMPRVLASECTRKWDCGNGCCVGGECVDECHEGPPPPSPPTISAELICVMGRSGWCISQGTLTLTVFDPQGYALTISGEMSGVPFTCSGSCTLDMSIGRGYAIYTVSSTSGLSASGSRTWWYDPIPPVPVMTLAGTPGSNGWYVSQTKVTWSASDANSGLSAGELIVDGAPAGWSKILGDGVHTVFSNALDVAGNPGSIKQTISVDTLAPTIQITAAGEQASDGWYSTPVELSAAASDATSGVNGDVLMSFDNGGSWETGPRTLTDGMYDVLFRVPDLAGNLATSPLIFKIDTRPPSIVLNETGSPGKGGWYISPAGISAAVEDDLSGVASIQYRVNGGPWQPGDSITLGEGVYMLEFQAFDAAGNMTTAAREIRLDLTPPAYTFDPALNGTVVAGTYSLSGSVSDQTSTVQSVEFSSDGMTWLPASLSGSAWSFGWDSTAFDNGDHTLFLRAIDTAGNLGEPIRVSVILDNIPPYVKLAETWNIWEGGELAVFPSIIPLQSIRISVHDPLQRFPDQVIYDSLPAPTMVVWDRVIGPGSAPPGSYLVTVEVCDIHGLCSADTGTIVIPDTPAPTPIPAQGTEHKRWWSLPDANPRLLESKQEQPVTMPDLEVPTQEEAPIIPFPVWTLVVIGALLLSFVLLLLLDPRPSALRSLTRSLHPYIQ